MLRYLPLVLVAACGSVGERPDAPATGPQTLSVAVTGGGSVTSAPAGITCGTACTASFDANSSVTLTATPDATSVFVGWTGDCSGTGPCSVTMDGAKSVTAAFALHGSVRWSAQIGLTGQDLIYKVAVDPAGDVIVAGTVSDPATDLYVAKYDHTDGHEVWKKRFTTETGEYFGGLATDAEGNVYLAARILFGSAVFGTTTVTGDFTGNIVALRLTAAAGEVAWVKQWGGSGQDEPVALAVSGADLYVVGGTSSNPATFDTLTLAGAINYGFVVRAKISDGTAVAAKLLAGNIDVRDVAVNGTDVAVVGDTRQTFAVDAACTASNSGTGEDSMIIALTGQTLVCRWARTFGDFVANNNASISAVAAFPGGGWVFTGSFQGNILFAPSGSSLGSHGMFDIFASRFTADGSHVWSFRYGDTGFDLGAGVAVTPQGNTLLAGWFDNTITFGTTTVTGKSNTYVTRMSASTTPMHEWAVGIGGDDTDSANGIATAPDGSVYVVTSFYGMTSVGGKALTSVGDSDAWIAALAP